MNTHLHLNGSFPCTLSLCSNRLHSWSINYVVKHSSSQPLGITKWSMKDAKGCENNIGFHWDCISLRKYPPWLRAPFKVEILSQPLDCTINKHIRMFGLDIFSGRVRSRVGNQMEVKNPCPTCLLYKSKKIDLYAFSMTFFRSLGVPLATWQ